MKGRERERERKGVTPGRRSGIPSGHTRREAITGVHSESHNTGVNPGSDPANYPARIPPRNGESTWPEAHRRETTMPPQAAAAISRIRSADGFPLRARGQNIECVPHRGGGGGARQKGRR